MVSHHEREDDGGELDALDHPHDGRADQLDAGEDVDAQRLDVTDVDVVGLILGRHQQQQHPLHELYYRTATNDTSSTVMRNVAKLSAYRPLSAFKTQNINDILRTSGRYAAATTTPDTITDLNHGFFRTNNAPFVAGIQDTVLCLTMLVTF